MLRFAAYAWEKGGSKQVVYRAADGDIHELFVPVGGSWDKINLTGSPNFFPQPAADTGFAGYEWEAGSSKQVVYIAPDGRIHELFVSVGGSWHFANLTELARQPPRVPLIVDEISFAGYEWKAGETKQVVYSTPGGRVHELFVPVGGSWDHADLTQVTGAPTENANFPVIAGYEWEAGGTKQVVYRAADSHIHELFVPAGGSWDHADLTQMTGAPEPDLASTFVGYEWEAGGSKQVVYISADGHIHELFVSVGGSWDHADLTQTTGASQPQPDTAFAAFQWEAGGTKQVVYRTEDGHIHELFRPVGGSWDKTDLTQMTGAPPANTNSPIIAGYEWKAGGTKQVVFLTGNGHIHELFVSVEGSWDHADLTQMTGAPPVA
jgi:hypothetical protein